MTAQTLPLSIPRVFVVNTMLAGCVALLFSMGLLTGDYPLRPAEVISALVGDADPLVELIVIDTRLPRLCVGLGVGMALGLAGEMVQTLLRDSLATPDVIGFTAGAGAGAIGSILLTGGTAYLLSGATIGGTAAALLVFSLAWDRGIQPLRLVLIGVGVSMTLAVCSNLMISGLDPHMANDFARWLIGSLNNRTWIDAALIWACLPVLSLIAFYRQFYLARMSLDDDLIRALGLRLMTERAWALAISVMLVAAAVAAAGPLAFVAFASGPIAHGLSGAPRPTLGSAALSGGVIVLSADLLARLLAGDLGLPAGVFTALLGAPVLIGVLLQSREGTHD